MSEIKIVPKAGEESGPVEVIEQAIIAMANAMRVLSAGRLKREALVTLIHDNSKVAKSTIRVVLNNLDALETTWLKPRPLPPANPAAKK